MSLNITLGTDPELFLANPDGSFHNALDGTVWGNKKNPEPTSYGAIQIDGMAVEFNTNPTTSIDQFSRFIGQGIQDVRKRWPDKQVMDTSVVQLSEKYLKDQPYESVRLGCDPDYNPYVHVDSGLTAFSAPAEDTPFRTAGGHIHIGWTNDADVDNEFHLSLCRELALELDWFFLPFADVFDTAGSKRAELYGKPGAFRPKPYGMEYRVLSNFWVFKPTFRKCVAAVSVGIVRALEKNVSTARDNGPSVRAWEQFTKGSSMRASSRNAYMGRVMRNITPFLSEEEMKHVFTK